MAEGVASLRNSLMLNRPSLNWGSIPALNGEPLRIQETSLTVIASAPWQVEARGRQSWAESPDWDGQNGN
jgi:hypothetical protein